jgi:hypothetical protein
MSSTEHFVESAGRRVGELTPDDLELERYLLDLTLQPLDEFEGFSHIEQYLLSALRYQLNYSCYALATAQLYSMKTRLFVTHLQTQFRLFTVWESPQMLSVNR